MKGIRLVLAAAIIIGAVLLVWVLRGQDEAIMLAGGIALTFVVFSLVLADEHARWIGNTSNVPVWGVVVAGLATLYFVIPLIIEVGGGVWEAIRDVISIQSCIPGSVGLIFVIGFIILLRQRGSKPSRRRTTKKDDKDDDDDEDDEKP